MNFVVYPLSLYILKIKETEGPIIDIIIVFSVFEVNKGERKETCKSVKFSALQNKIYTVTDQTVAKLKISSFIR